MQLPALLPKKYFDSYTAVIGDECHTFKAKSLTSIMTKLHEAKYRIGFTGTLDGTKTHRLVLEGLFGLSDRVTSTADLMARDQLAQLKIKILALRHESCKLRLIKMKWNTLYHMIKEMYSSKILFAI